MIDKIYNKSYMRTTMRLQLIPLLLSLVFAQAQASFAEAEATATKGPIQLTLRLYKNKVPRHSGESALWVQLEIKNVGRKEITVYDDFFYEADRINDSSKGCSYTICIEVTDSKGKPVKFQRPPFGDHHLSGDPDRGLLKKRWNPTDPEEKKYKARLEAALADWKRQGVSEEDSARKLLDWQRDNPAPEKGPKRDLGLAPGASRKSIGHHYRIYEDREPIPGFVRREYTEVADYFFPRPGKYRVRAIYDHKELKDFKKNYEEGCRRLEKEKGIKCYPLRPPNPENIRVATPFIDFEVLP